MKKFLTFFILCCFIYSSLSLPCVRPPTSQAKCAPTIKPSKGQDLGEPILAVKKKQERLETFPEVFLKCEFCKKRSKKCETWNFALSESPAVITKIMFDFFILTE
jgi:hypothetical protein